MSRGQKVRNSGEPMEALLEKLEKHVSEWLKNQDLDTVNGRRTEILKHCLAEGKSEKGLFRFDSSDWWWKDNSFFGLCITSCGGKSNGSGNLRHSIYKYY